MVIIKMKPFVLSRSFVEDQIAHFDPSVKCDQLHPGSCDTNFVYQVLGTTRAISKLYLMVHLVPFLLKIKKIRKQ